MSKTTSLVAALGVFGALAYLLNPLPPDAPSAKRTVAAGQVTAPAVTAVAHSGTPERSAGAVTRPPAQDATVRLVQQIQTELLRLGCYSGTVDGQWTPETQQAMQVLGERVRVLRPVETPDYIMLALARSQTSHICTARDRATAAARLPARVEPSAAALKAAERAPGSARQRQADRAQSAPNGTRGHVTRRAGNRDASPDIRTTERVSADTDEDIALRPRDRDNDIAGENRMGLGAAPPNPLRADADGPAPTRSLGASVAELPPPPAARRAEREARLASTPSRPRRDWKRNVFIQLRESGP